MSAHNATIRMLLEDFHRNVLPSHVEEFVERDMSLGSVLSPKPGNLVKVVIGMRRAGKTYRLYQEIQRLLSQGVPSSRICYFNFDDDRLRPYADNLVSQVIEIFFEMNPSARKEGVFLFFDEIQEVPEWDVAARRIADTEKATIYVTGSSSKMLSTDVATEFRGRSLAYELLPYSFREYVRCHGAEPVEEKDLFDKEQVSVLKNMFKRYLVEGGFPGVQGLDDLERAQVLQTYAQLTVARDVVERNGFSNAAYARNLARIALASSARDFSLSKVHNMGKSMGYSPGRATIANMIEAFEDAHMLYGVYEYSHSAQKVRLGGFKLYAADPGLFCALSPAANDGMTHALETAVYLEMRRRQSSARMGSIALLKLKSGKEVDFIEGDEAFEQAYRLVQVSFSMHDPATFAREVEALKEAMVRFGKHEGVIVTIDEEDELHVEEGVIRIVPAWRWFLADEFKGLPEEAMF